MFLNERLLLPRLIFRQVRGSLPGPSSHLPAWRWRESGPLGQRRRLNVHQVADDTSHGIGMSFPGDLLGVLAPATGPAY